MKTKKEIEELILDEFRKINARVNDSVPVKTYEFSIVQKLNPKEQEMFHDAVENLIHEDYIRCVEEPMPCFVLRKKGYDRIYS